MTKIQINSLRELKVDGEEVNCMFDASNSHGNMEFEILIFVDGCAPLVLVFSIGRS